MDYPHAMTYLKLENIVFIYGKKYKNFSIGDINCEIERGEILAIVGPSGCGKTTLLKIILGDIIPDKGSIFLNNKNITNLDIEKRNIGYVPQDQGLFPHLNVYENIAIGLKSKKIPKHEIKEKIDTLTKIAELNDLQKRKIHELSGGQKQRLSIIRAIAVNPDIILLDEPFSGVDASLKDQLSLYIKNIQNFANLTVILVTHDINEAKSMADKILVMNKGKILQYGTPTEILCAPNSIDTAISMNLANIFSKEIGSLFTNQKIKSFIRINPNLIQISKIPNKINNGYQGTILSIVPDLNTEIKRYVIKILNSGENTLNDHIIIQVHKKIKENKFRIEDQILVEFPLESIEYF